MMMTLIVFVVGYVIIGLIIGSVMFGISCSGGPPARGFGYFVEWAKHMGLAMLWGPYIIFTMFELYTG